MAFRTLAYGTAASRVGDRETALATLVTSLTTVAASLTTADTELDAAVAGFVAVTATQAAVDVLVADGASPTQAHVNDLVTAWNTFKAAEALARTDITEGKAALDTGRTDIAAAQADLNAKGVVTGDLILSYLNGKTLNEVRAAMRALDFMIEGSI